MTVLEQAMVVAVGVWLLALSFVMLLVVRQIGLLTVRLSFAAPDVPVDEVGMPLGTVVPPEILDLIEARGEDRTVVFMSGTCGDCRGLARSMTPDDVGGAICLVAGEPSLAQEVADLLPKGARHGLEPTASRVATALGIDTVPFALRVESGVVHRKVYLRSAADLAVLEEDPAGPLERRQEGEGPVALVTVSGNGTGTSREGS